MESIAVELFVNRKCLPIAITNKTTAKEVIKELKEIGLDVSILWISQPQMSIVMGNSKVFPMIQTPGAFL
jgi:hypothetical protein